MQMLFVVLALFSAAAVAVPIVLDQHGYQAYPITSSEYLKMVLGRTPGMVAMTKTMATETDVVSLLQTLQLPEAAKIAEQVNLGQILADSQLQSYTLFAPTDNAVRNWKKQVPELAADLDTLTRLCKAWIVPSIVRSSDIANEKVVQSMNGAKLRFNIYKQAQAVTVNGAPIVEVDHQATHGIVHVVDQVIFPLPEDNIFETLAKLSKFSMFVELVRQAGLEQTLRATDGLTMFAPINEAFLLLPRGVLADLAADEDKLRQVLKYHVVMGTRYSAGITDNRRIAAMEGSMITFNIDSNGEICLNKDTMDEPAQAKIMYADMPSTNGVIHVINRVLLPPQGRFIVQL